MEKASDFLDKKNIIAVVGASANPEKWGFKIFNELKSRGFSVFPVNPKHSKIGNYACYADLSSLAKKPDVVITVVPPKVTEMIVRECKKLQIDRIWMQPGSESEEAIAFCEKNSIKIIANTCFILDNPNK